MSSLLEFWDAATELRETVKPDLVQTTSSIPQKLPLLSSSKTSTCCGCDDAHDNDPHLDTYSTFAKNLDEAAQNIVRQRPRYNRVYVLLTWWEMASSDRWHLASEAKELKDVFEQDYNFETEVLELSEDQAEDNLLEKLGEIKRNLAGARETKRNLFVLYYAGHGFYLNENRNKPQWKARGEDGSPKVNWYDLQYNLSRMKCDILLLFDCCYAVGMVRRDLDWGGTLEIIGACAENRKAGGEEGRSFTQAVKALLVEEARTHGGATTWRLATVMNNREWWQKSMNLQAEPKFLPIRKSSNGASTGPSQFETFILLVPLEKGGDDTSSQLSASTLAEPPVDSDARVLFKISFTSPPDLEEWKRWLENRPSGIQGIRVAAHNERNLKDILVKCHCLFESGSNLAVMSMPLWLWYAMPPDSAYEKIGTIYSDDLMNTLKVDAKIQTEVLATTMEKPQVGAEAQTEPVAKKFYQEMGVQTEKHTQAPSIPTSILPSVPIIFTKPPSPPPSYLIPINSTTAFSRQEEHPMIIQSTPPVYLNRNDGKNVSIRSFRLKPDFLLHQNLISTQEPNIASKITSGTQLRRNLFIGRHSPKISNNDLDSLINSKWPSPEALQAGPILKRLNNYY